MVSGYPFLPDVTVCTVESSFVYVTVVLVANLNWI
jgi:hypothetical protein